MRRQDHDDAGRDDAVGIPESRQYCRFGRRVLKGRSWLAPLLNNRLGDALNLEVIHEHLFFIEGTRIVDNVGYASWGKRFRESEDGREIRTLGDLPRYGYTLTGRIYDPDVMRQALDQLNDGYYYSLFSNQCQDWADRLKKRAAQVEKEWGLKPGQFRDGAQAVVSREMRKEKRVRPEEPASIGMGVFALVVGLGAILAPYYAGGAFARILGLYFIALGVGRVIYAFKGGDFRAGVPIVFFALIHLVAGVFFLVNSQIAVLGTSLLIALVLAVEGLTEIGVALFSRPLKNWLGTLISGLVALSFSLMVLSRWPTSGTKFLGALVGISLIVGGISTVYFSQVTRSDVV